MFSFTDEDVYTHYSLNFAYDLKTTYNYEIDFKLNIEDEFNAYVFNEKDLINTSRIFKIWYEEIMELTNKYPENKLIKKMSSSLWGYLVQFNIIKNTDKKSKYYDIVNEYNLDVSDISEWENETNFKLFDSDNNDYFEFLDTKNIYKYEFGRLKSFLTSYARVRIAKMILRENIVDDVIRIQTDGLVLTKPHIFKENLNIVEEKKATLKNVIWYSANTNNYNIQNRKNRKIIS